MARRPTREQQRTSRTGSAVVGLAFLLSGCAGLMHQVIWAKLLVQLIGGTAYAQAAVLAVFMGGLALGAVVFGRQADRYGRPLRTYVILELAIAAYGVLLPLIVAGAGALYVPLASRWFEVAGVALPLRFALAMAVVLAPAVAMGGTLPLLARHWIDRVDQTRRRVADLYALNSFGAVIGAGLAGFVALPVLGIPLSLALAAGLNAIAGLLVWPGAQREARTAARPDRAELKGRRRRGASPEPVAYSRLQWRVAVVALALTGCAAMGYEVLFARVIALSFGASTFSFSVMLMCFITGIALGSAIVARLRVRDPLWLFGVSQLLVVVALLATTPLVSRLPYLITLLRIDLQGGAFGFELFQLGKAALCGVVLLLPTTCLGFSFPLVAAIRVREPERVGASVGATYAWNTAGNVVGSVGTAVWLLPGLGLLGAFHLNLALNGAAGLACLLVAFGRPVPARAAASVAAAAVVAAYLGFGSGWLAPVNRSASHLHLRDGPDPSLSAGSRALHPATSFSAWTRTYTDGGPNAEVLFFEEDEHTTVLVVGAGESRVLFVNGKPDASLGPDDMETQLLLGHVPLFLAPEARTLLVIGHGSGITAGSALTHPIERIEIVEISRGVLHADALFAEFNHQVLDDPRVSVRLDDGQSFLRTVPRRYDVIISEPSNPWMAGVSGLFTIEYFEAARDKLNPGGIFTFWFHTYWMSDDMVELILRTLGEVFPHVLLFVDDDSGNVYATASLEPLEPDFAALERRFARPEVRDDLARLGITNLEGFLSHHRFSSERFRSLIHPGPVNSVAHQLLEYGAPRSFFSGENSFLLDRADPLVGLGVDGSVGESDVLLDRYIAYRRERGDPVSPEALEQAAHYAASIGGYGDRVAEALRERSREAAVRGSRAPL